MFLQTPGNGWPHAGNAVKQTLFTTHVYALHAVAGSLCEHGTATKRYAA